MSKDFTPGKGTDASQALARTLRAFVQMLPILLGMLLLTSLILTWLPRTGLQALFGRNESLDVLLGAVIGSVAMGHPLAGYILGGELLAGGVSLIAVTALIVSWVTVGVVQFPAEALLRGDARPAMDGAPRRRRHCRGHHGRGPACTIGF